MTISKILEGRHARCGWGRLGSITLLAALLTIFSVTTALAIGRWRDGMPASLVLGQADFTSHASNRSGSPDASSLSYPQSAAVDPTTGKLFVADTINNRILRYADPVALTNGAAAEAVLGAANFSDINGGTSASRMSWPKGIFVDQTGTLWVGDYYNSRVLRFDNASAKTNGANADGVLGQPNFTSSSMNKTQSGMGRPFGVFVDADGALWVADISFNRVLRFDNAAGKPDGSNADGVLGQDDFTSSIGATAQNRFQGPSAVWVSSGALFVGDNENNRVLRFDNISGKADGADADAVLGQPDFTTGWNACTQNKLAGAYGISVDAAGTLYVADRGNYRVLIFNNAASLASGADASHVLGQSDFTTCDRGASALQIDTPYGVFADDAGQVLWVADEGNNRVLRYQSGCAAQADGDWSETATWDCARVPANGDNVTIPVTWTVTLDADTADLFHLTLNGALVDNAVSHTLNLTGDWTNSGTFTPGAAIEVNFKAGALQYLSGDTPFYNLSTAISSTLDVGSALVSVAGTAANAGEIRRLAPAQDITLGADFTFKDGLGQDAVVIHQTGGTAMGLTTAQVNAHPLSAAFACATSTLTQTAVLRYFDLTPTNGSSVTADLTLAYYAGAGHSEANGIALDDLGFAHCEGGSWAVLPGTYTRSALGDYYLVKLSGFTFSSFSPFALVRNSHNAGLSGLSISQGVLTPAFISTTLEYTASVASSVTSLVVTPTAASEYAAIEVNGSPVTSGEPSAPISLDPGENLVTATVTAQDGVTVQDYLLTVTRQLSWGNGLAANMVLGQADFTSNSANRGGSTSELGFDNPYDAAVDPTTGKLFVVEEINQRVLRFANPAALEDGAAAEAVLGQDDLSSKVWGQGANRLFFPKGVFVDKTGTLWVADTSNHRVLRFDNAASKANGANADGVLGQPNFNTLGSATSKTGMNTPMGLFVDADGTLWVADSSNNRVLRFDNAATKANGAGADGVLGQPDFTSNSAAVTQSGMNTPFDVWVSQGALFVADRANNRVLRFDNAAGKADGANADGVLGQTNFTTNNSYCMQNKIGFPSGLSVDAAGTLVVSDFWYSRILIFNNAAGLANGANASAVLGQTNFYACLYSSTDSTLYHPMGVFSDGASQAAWVADVGNHRLLRFQATSTAIADGSWDLASTWDNNRTPVKKSNVIIPANRTVALNTTPPDLNHLLIAGSLDNDASAHTLNLTGDWTNRGSFTPGNYIGVSFKSGALQHLSGDTAFYDLSLSSQYAQYPTILDVGSAAVTVAGTVNNAGEIRRLAPAQDITLGADFTFNDGVGQASVVLHQTAGDPLGLTAAQINARASTDNLDCGSDILSRPPAWRLFVITPTVGANVTADLTLAYFDGQNNSEANSVPLEDFDIAHCEGGSWVFLEGTYERWSSGDYRFVKLSGYTFSSFSPFVLARNSHNANLRDLVLSDGTLTPAFDPAVTSYTTTVSGLVPFITLTPYNAQDYATIFVNGTQVYSGWSSDPIDLAMGTTVITTTVNAEDGVTKKNYILTVTRVPSSDASLSGLEINHGTLAPDFYTDDTSYTAVVSNSINSLKLRPTASAGVYAAITVNGVSVTSGSSSAPISLHAGENLITTTVTAQDGVATQDYLVSVTRFYRDPDDLSAGSWKDGLDASLVLGQADFTSGDANRGGSTDDLGLNVPTHLAIDPTSGKLFVADQNNNRVLRYASPAALANGAAAEAVLGQDDFSGNGSDTAANRMNYPWGVYVDKNGALWVGDTYNNRVLRFDHAASKANGAGANGVLGQPDFTSRNGGVTRNRMSNPYGIFVDAGGTLWVADSGANRVLRFVNAAAKANGANADGVLGQPDFTSSNSVTSQDGMYYPTAVWVSSGTLFVADDYNYRVLRFDNAAAKADGANADGVLGQPDFTSTSWWGCHPNSFYENYGLSVDSAGALYVSDFYDQRVMIFDHAAALPNGAAASHVLGQPDFNTCNSGTTASSMKWPTGVFAESSGGVVWVADGSNHRVLRFNAGCSAVANGSWSQASTWDCRRTPQDGDSVTIPVTWTVTLDADSADLFNLTLKGKLLNDASPHSLSLNRDWTNTGTFTPGSWITVNFDAGDLQYLHGNTTFYNLGVTGNTTLDVGSAAVTVNGTATNAGEIRRLAPAQAVTLGSSFTFKDGAGQDSLVIRQTGGTAMGNTTAQIDVHPSLAAFLGCAFNPLYGYPALRYYNITPTNAANVTADLTLAYYAGPSNSEAEGVDPADFELAHCEGGNWVALPGSYTRWSSGDYRFVKLSGHTYSSFSPFALIENVHDANLGALALSAGTLTPAFSPATTRYNASVGLAVTAITITPTASANATIRVNGSPVTSGSPSAPINLVLGQNIITATLTAKDTTTVKNYVLTVTRQNSASSDASLSALKPGYGSLSPAFQPATLSYTDIVSYSVSSLALTPTANEAHATIQARVNGGSWSPVTSGSASSPLPLNVGDNTVEVKVTAQDNATTRTYTLTVTRADKSELAGLGFSVGSLTPNFEPGVKQYTLSLPSGTTSISLLLYPGYNISSISVRINDGNWIKILPGQPSPPLVVHGGDNTIKIAYTYAALSQAQASVEAESTTIYTILVQRPDPNIFYLPHLIISGAAR
jgi:DNA-binding beta-propeller fold protein YncE